MNFPEYFGDEDKDERKLGLCEECEGVHADVLREAGEFGNVARGQENGGGRGDGRGDGNGQDQDMGSTGGHAGGQLGQNEAEEEIPGGDCHVRPLDG